jgi:hypothetical protein
LKGNLKGMKLLKCKSSINKLMVILEFFSNIFYNVFIVKKRSNQKLFNLIFHFSFFINFFKKYPVCENQHFKIWLIYFKMLIPLLNVESFWKNLGERIVSSKYHTLWKPDSTNIIKLWYLPNIGGHMWRHATKKWVF